MRKKYLYIILICLVAWQFQSCEDNVSDTNSGNIELELEGLLYLGTDYQYESWLMIDGVPNSLGTFTISESGQISNRLYNYNLEDLRRASGLMISIEPINDSDPQPSNTVVLAGDFLNKGAKLTVDHSAALNVEFTDISGLYLLNTPTDNDTTNDLSGIWFVNDTGSVVTAGLQLPALPSGWKYNAWINIGDTIIETGKFTDPSMPDESSLYNDIVNPAPPFPGEDFLINPPDTFNFPIDLSDETVRITIEPDVPDLDEPFPIVPLRANLAEEPEARRLYKMINNVENFPKGLASRSDY